MKIHLTSAAHDFITEVTRRCAGEVGGMGYCHVDGSTVVVDEAFLLPQEVSGASVEFDADAIAIACERAAIAGKIEELRFSWHSHGTMRTFWSSIDDNGIAQYMSGGTPWLASLVVNRKGDMLGRIDVANVPIAGVAQFRDVDVDVAAVDRTNGRARAEIDQFVREMPHRRWPRSTNERSFNERSLRVPSLHEMTDDEWLRAQGDPWDTVFTG